MGDNSASVIGGELYCISGVLSGIGLRYLVVIRANILSYTQDAYTPNYG